VKITDYEPKRPLKTLLPGEPQCAPFAAALAESHVTLLRKLHATDIWNKFVSTNYPLKWMIMRITASSWLINLAVYWMA